YLSAGRTPRAISPTWSSGSATASLRSPSVPRSRRGLPPVLPTGPCRHDEGESLVRTPSMLKALGTDIGTIHFVGIGGIGMSGIAEGMHRLGYSVQGSDVSESYVVEKLRKSGIPVAIGHSADNLGEAAVVVCSS